MSQLEVAIAQIYERLPEIVKEESDRHLKNFRPAKSADTKALYQKRLTTFVEELLERLRSI